MCWYYWSDLKNAMVESGEENQIISGDENTNK